MIMARSKIDKNVTLIAGDTELIGDVRFTNQLYVNGRVTGNVLAENDSATLIISEEGYVAGEVTVPNVVINGVVEGNVYASNRVELAAHAKVKGNLYYKLIEMHLGAMVDGQLVHEEKAEAPTRNVHTLPLEGGNTE
jgi:cytoskeletal protein CcmA (bactofilin family)